LKDVLHKFPSAMLHTGGSYEKAKAKSRERTRRFRMRQRVAAVALNVEDEANLAYVRRVWGMPSDAEVLRAALGFLMVVTRLGLKRIDVRVYDALVAAEEARQAKLGQQPTERPDPPERDPT
jgi:hypothetical protein